MSPTLRDGDLIFIVPTPGGRAGYQRGEVVVARIPVSSVPGAVDVISVKRVVGLPGEYVRTGGDGSVWVEDELLHEPYLTPEAQRSPGSAMSWPCDDGEYVLMGDNRARSWGVRHIAPVPVEKIIGKVWLKIPTRSLLGRSNRGHSRGTD